MWEVLGTPKFAKSVQLQAKAKMSLEMKSPGIQKAWPSARWQPSNSKAQKVETGKLVEKPNIGSKNPSQNEKKE